MRCKRSARCARGAASLARVGQEGKDGAPFGPHRGALVIGLSSVRHTMFLQWCPEIADNGQRAKLPENPSNVTLAGRNGKLING